MIPYIHTQNGLNFVLNNRPISLSSSDKGFEDIKSAVVGGASAETIEALVNENATKVKEALQLSSLLKYEDGEVLYAGEAVHNYVVDKIIQLHEAGEDVKPLCNFLELLQDNPSQSITTRLYAFLEKGGMPLTKDGYFLAYKAVRQDFKDIHSGMFDNSVGQFVSIERNKVDDNHSVTCSSGLHVCSFDYLPSFSHANGHIMVCEVNPAHVVAIPTDYSDTKMRVCAYRVVGEVEGWYQEHKDVLAESPVNRDYDEEEEEDGYDVVTPDGDLVAHFNDRQDAEEFVDGKVRISGTYDVLEVVDTNTGSVVYHVA